MAIATEKRLDGIYELHYNAYHAWTHLQSDVNYDPFPIPPPR